MLSRSWWRRGQFRAVKLKAEHFRIFMRNFVAGEWRKIIGEEFRRVNEKKAQAMEILAGELSDFSTSPQVSVSWCSSLTYSLLCYS